VQPRIYTDQRGLTNGLICVDPRESVAGSNFQCVAAVNKGCCQVLHSHVFPFTGCTQSTRRDHLRECAAQCKLEVEENYEDSR
jgi:hypothetical protein